MSVTKTQKYFISLALVTIFFLICHNIWINSIVSMISVYLLCEKKLQFKSVFSAAGISLAVGIIDYVLQYILLLNSLTTNFSIIAEDLFCFLLFYLILILKLSHRKQNNYRVFILLFIIAAAIRSIIHICHNVTLIENQNNFIEYIQMLSHSWIPFLRNISYFVAIIGLLVPRKTKTTAVNTD